MSKGLRVWVMAFGLTALLAQVCSAQGQVWTERQITAGGVFGTPKLWQDTIYYYSQGAGYNEVYKWTEAGGSIRMLGGDGIDRSPSAVWQDNLVISRYAGGQYDLYLYDPIAGERPISTAIGNQRRPDIYGSTVVWEDHRETYSQIYIWDSVNGERPLSPSSGDQTNPKIWGDLVTWEDDRRSDYFGGKKDVYRWSPGTGEQLVAYDSYSPAIYEGRIVGWTKAYYDEYPPYRFYPGTLWEWTAAGGVQTLAEHNWTTGFQNTDMWGNLVAAEYGRAWDPVHGFTYNAVNQPSVYGIQVAGVRNNDVYLEVLVPEPDSLMALGWLAGGLGLAISIRRPGRKEAIS